MPVVTARVWTPRRKWLGNLIPTIFWLPPACAGLYLILLKTQLLNTGVWFLVLSTVLGWLAVNQFGFFENSAMKENLEEILKAGNKELSGDRVFVGFATPKYSSMVDAHEDVGFLQILSDKLVFVSESRELEIMKSDITNLQFRPNVHAILLLGRWISIEAKVGNKQIRMLVEPRERQTLLANRIYGSKLIKRLQTWQNFAKK